MRSALTTDISSICGKKDADPAKVEAILLEELNKLSKTSPSAKEMQRIKKRYPHELASNLKSLEGLSAAWPGFSDWAVGKAWLEYPDKIARQGRRHSEITATYCRPGLQSRGAFCSLKSMGLPRQTVRLN